MTSNLHTLFNPISIAVLGASRQEGKVGNIVVKNLLESGFPGPIYPINPASEDIHGLKCYPSLESIPQKADLVSISIPAQFVLENIKKAVEIGYTNFVVFSAGYKEIGESGQVLEDELKQFAKDKNINIIGPNCLGYYNNDSKINLTFGKVSNQSGNLRFVSQSGAVVTALFDYAAHHSLGFRDCITLGNKTILNENDILNYYLETIKQGDVIGLYLESISQGQTFLDLCQKLVIKKIPVFIIKPGRHSTSQKAMLSHTGSLSGEDNVLDMALKEAGVLRVEGFEELFDLTRAFSWLAPPLGKNIAIVSNAGGPAVVSSDLVIDYGLELAVLSPETEKTLQENLPRFAGIHNPVDVLGDAQSDRYKIAIEAVLKEESVNSVLVLLTPQTMTDIDNIANVISTLFSQYKKPIVASFIGGDVTQTGAKILDQKKVPCYNYPERSIRAISRVFYQSLLQPTFQPLIPVPKQDISSTQGILDFVTTQQLATSFSISIPNYLELNSTQDLQNYIQAFGYPLVLKATGPSLVHKTESKAVYINLNTYTDALVAYRSLQPLQSSFPNTKLIAQKQINPGLELIFGLKNDPTFGPVAMFGAGGKWVELLHDRNLCLLPLNFEKATQLINTSKLSKVLLGYRGEQGYPINVLAQTLVNISELFTKYNNIQELEVNPIILTHDTAWCVDIRVIIG